MLSEDAILSAKILIVDDDKSILQFFKAALQAAGYRNITTSSNPCGVITRFVEENPDLLILDIMMPRLDGLQLLEILQQSMQAEFRLPIMVTTAFPTRERRHSALAKGAIDFLEKPFDVEDLVLRVRNLIKMRLAFRASEERNLDLMKELVERSEELAGCQLKLKEAQLEVIARLASAGEKRDDDTGKHTQRVAVTSAMIASELGFDCNRVELIKHAAPLHDVGKIGVCDSILLKNNKLTRDEEVVMQQHCRIGSALLTGGRSDIVQMADRIALGHHERWDGRGYPQGFVEDEISIEGRIVAVADVFDALTHERPYKKAWPLSESVEEIRRQSGRHFDPQVVDAFSKLPHSALI